jgi:hypothetical protein
MYFILILLVIPLLVELFSNPWSYLQYERFSIFALECDHATRTHVLRGESACSNDCATTLVQTCLNPPISSSLQLDNLTSCNGLQSTRIKPRSNEDESARELVVARPWIAVLKVTSYDRFLFQKNCHCVLNFLVMFLKFGTYNNE